MSKLFIFAIGGTGERVLRSMTMLLAAGVPSFNNYDVYPIIIDYDADNADKKRTRNTLDVYRRINRLGFAKHPVANMSEKDTNRGQFFGCPIKELNGLNKFVLDFNPGNSNLKFRDKIEYDLIKGDMVNTKALLESLYDTSDDPTTELNLDLRVGFKGNPNIGSVIFHKLAERSEYQSFVSNYHKNQGDRVVIIGSLFGGTGASGIPVLVQQIKTDIEDVDMAALMIQPYFAPEITPGGAVNAHLFDSKTKAALNFYDASGLKDKLSAIYHIGDSYPTVIPYSEGGNTQKNNANPVEFIAALAIEHFASGCAATGGNRDKEYMFGLSKDIESVVDDNGKRTVCRIFTEDFDTVSKDAVLKYMDAFAFCMKYFSEQIYASKVKTGNVYWDLLGLATIERRYSTDSNKLQDILMALDEYSKLFREWLAELDFAGDDKNHIQPNSHRLSFYDLSKDYPMVVERPLSSKPERRGFTLPSIIGGGAPKNQKIKYSSLKVGNITAVLNTQMTDRGHLDHKQLKTNDKEYIFMDILRATGIDIITNY